MTLESSEPQNGAKEAFEGHSGPYAFWHQGSTSQLKQVRQCAEQNLKPWYWFMEIQLHQHVE